MPFSKTTGLSGISIRKNPAAEKLRIKEFYFSLYLSSEQIFVNSLISTGGLGYIKLQLLYQLIN